MGAGAIAASSGPRLLILTCAWSIRVSSTSWMRHHAARSPERGHDLDAAVARLPDPELMRAALQYHCCAGEHAALA